MTTPDPITTALGFTEDDAARILAEQYSDGRDYDLIRYSEQWIDREKAIAAIMAATVIASEQIQMLKTGMDKAYDDLAESSREWAGWQTRANTAETEITRLTSQLEQAERVMVEVRQFIRTKGEISFLAIVPKLTEFIEASQWIKDRQAKGEG